jgi:pimeloyl-ACP methyl ester carboxylesterase
MAQLCHADAACNAAYPNLEEAIYAVMATLNENPATVPVTDPNTGRTYQAVVNGDLFLTAVFLAMYEPSLIPALPALVFNTQAGDYQLLSTLLPLALFQPTFSVGMYQTVVCAEETNFDPAHMPIAGVRPELGRMMQKDNTTLIKTCRLWKILPLKPEDVDPPVVSNVPTLLLSGRFDPITPASNAESVAQTLRNSYAYTFPNTSHGAFFSSQCASQIAEDFLNDPTSSPADTCLADQPATFDMVTPDKVIMTPAMNNVLDILNGRRLNSAEWLVLSLLVLGSFFIVWPLAWIIRQIWQRPAQSRRPGCLITWGGPLLVVMLTGLAAIFLISLAALAIATEPGWLMAGIPRGAAPLFGLPFLLLLTTLAMLLVSVIVWLRGYWAIWRRLYYTSLTLAAFGVVGVLAQWGMLTVFL